MISHFYKCIFIHIPKTGGTSIQKLIWPDSKDLSRENLWCNYKDSRSLNKYQKGALQHLYAKNVRKEVGMEVFDAYYKFSFIRNPYDRIVSQFIYMSLRQNLRMLVGMEENTSFLDYLYLIQKVDHVQWQSQYRFVYDDNGNLLVDELFRFEDFKGRVGDLVKKINLKEKFDDIPHFKKGQREHYKYYYCSDSFELVSSMFQLDIDSFNYDF